MNNAIVKVGGYEIPLVGIPAHATEEECDFCKKRKYFLDVLLEGKAFICPECVKILRAQLEWKE